MTAGVKRITSFTIAILLILGITFSLTACSGKEETVELSEGATTYYKTWEEARLDYFPNAEEGKYNMNEVTYAIDKIVEAGHHNLEGGYMDEAYECAQQSYYGYYEVCGFERRAMAEISGARKNEVEFIYRDLRKAVKNSSVEDYDDAATRLRKALYTDARKLSPISAEFVEKLSGDSEFADFYLGITGETLEDLQEQVGIETSSGGTATSSFLQAFLILLREGLEAILVIGGIIAYLIKSGNKKKVVPVYIGSFIAIGLSVIAAWILNIIKSANTANGVKQELIEGFAALTAVVVLFYVSNWMLSKSESEVWQRYINDKVESSVSRGSMLALGFTAFLAVFREGAEVILFYQQIISDAQKSDTMSSVWLGVAVAVVVLAAIFIAIRFFSVKLPLKPFFTATSILMAALAIIFLGKGIKELMEGELFDSLNIFIPGLSPLIEKIPSNDFFDTFGLYPYVETVVPQLLLLIATIILFIVSGKRSKKIKAQLAAEANVETDKAAESKEVAEKVSERSQK